MLQVTKCWSIQKQIIISKIPIEWEQVWFETAQQKPFYICMPYDGDDDSLYHDIQKKLHKKETVWIQKSMFLCHVTSITLDEKRYLCFKFLCETLLSYIIFFVLIFVVVLSICIHLLWKTYCY
jgi:CRISPR/Cas system-associated endoribonuclease Cas2